MKRAALLLLLAGVPIAVAAQGSALKSGVFNPPRQAPELSLRGSDGSELKLSRYHGKVVALAFGYTFCPDVCPTTVLELAEVRKNLGAMAKDFQVVYVTVDPERDTPEQLRKWLAFFDSTFVGGSGTVEQLAQVRKAYGITITKKPLEGNPAAYQIHHSSFVYLIDRQGMLRAMKPFGVPVEDITHDVKVFLKGK